MHRCSIALVQKIGTYLTGTGNGPSTWDQITPFLEKTLPRQVQGLPQSIDTVIQKRYQRARKSSSNFQGSLDGIHLTSLKLAIDDRVLPPVLKALLW